MGFLNFDLKKNIFEGFNPTLEEKEGEKTLIARLRSVVDLMVKRGPTKVFFSERIMSVVVVDWVVGG